MKTNIKYLLLVVMAVVGLTASAQQRRISGTVSDDFDVIMGASVTELNADNRIVSATMTDMNGNFTMTIKDPNNILQIKFMGFQTFKEKIGTRTVFKVKLQDATKTIAPVEIKAKKIKQTNGLAIPEREMSVASQTFNMEEMEGLAFESVDQALQGKIAGLDIVANSGNLGAGTTMRLRGVTSINGNTQPLIVVDDHIFEIPADAQQIDFENLDNEEQFSSLLSINTEDIESIEVLKDASATAIWGSQGANGVLKIKTKRGARGKTRVTFSYKFQGTWMPQGLNMLNGDNYTMMLKEAYFNPFQNPTSAAIPELEYNDNYRLIYNNFSESNTDWMDAVSQFGQGHFSSVTVSGGGEKATFRISAGYDKEKGTIIKQELDRFTSRMVLDYWVSDRIKFSSTFQLTYTDNLKNWKGFNDAGDDILFIAYKAMPNMSIYEHDAGPNGGKLTGDYFNMLPLTGNTGFTTSSSLADMYRNGNPVAIANKAWRSEKDYTIKPQFDLTYKLLGKDDSETQLNYTGDVNINIFNYTKEKYYPSSLTRNAWGLLDDANNEFIKRNYASNNEYKSLEFSTRHTLNFYPKFKNTDHAVAAMVRYEMTTGNSDTQYLESFGLPTGISDPTVEAYLQNGNTSDGEWRSMSFTGSVHYSYKSKYNFDVTVRSDGKTVFGSGNKFGTFPGISGRWNISDEEFMKPTRKWLSMLAFKPGWGITGNTVGVSNSQYNKYASNGTYNGNTSIVPQNLRLTDLRWEKTKQWNVGFTLGLLDDLFTINLDIYKKKTSDLVQYNVVIPSTTGFPSLEAQNVGDMENRGWELYVNTGRFAKVGKFYMTGNFNFSQNYNKVTRMDPSVLSSLNKDYSYSSPNGEYLNRVQIGNALGSIYGFRYKGVYRYDYDHSGYTKISQNTYGNSEDGFQINPTTGKKVVINTAAMAAVRGENSTCPVAKDSKGNIIYDAKGNPLQMYFNYGGLNYKFEGGDAIYEDINHDGQINELDIVYLGNCNPKINGGFGLSFTYDRWTLRTSFNFRAGNKIINNARLEAESMRTNVNQSQATTWRWRKNGDITEIPRAMSSEAAGGRTYNSLGSDRYVEDGDFMRFQYLNLSYRFDEKKLKKHGLSGLSLSATVNNIWCWTKYTGIDPEIAQSGWGVATDNSKTPRAKSFTVNLNLSF